MSVNLRRSSVFIALLTACLGVIVAAALIVTTTRLHIAAQRVGISVESVRVSEELGLGLAALRDDAEDTPSITVGEDNVRRLLSEATQYVDSPTEQAVLDRLTANVDRYVAALRNATARGARGRPLARRRPTRSKRPTPLRASSVA